MSTQVELKLQIINSWVENQNTVDCLDFLIDAFRFLRNECANNPDTQDLISKNVKIVESSKNIMSYFCTQDLDEKQRLCLVVGLQFLGNFLVKNKNNQLLVWSKCQDLLAQCLKCNCSKVQNCTLMILYNIFLGNPEIINNITQPYQNIIELLTANNASEYTSFIVELFILNPQYHYKFYNQLNLTCKCIVIEAVQQFSENSNNTAIDGQILSFYAHEFSKLADWVLNCLKKDVDSTNVVEIVKILDLLISFSINEVNGHLEILQNKTSLFIDCVMLLRAVHSISKNEGNAFTMVSKLSGRNEKENNYFNNPVFGFKAALVRIIGNLCWKSKKNQNLIRELEGIQVLLDCCCIDEKNPFISQWCIFAIHNICDDSTENQEVISGLSTKGVVDAKKLQELGIVLNTNNGCEKLCIYPYEKNQ